MGENIIDQSDFNSLINIYQANHNVYLASNESELLESIKNSLQSCQFASAYYEVKGKDLILEYSFNPSKHCPIDTATSHFELSDGEVGKIISRGIQILDLKETVQSELPLSFFQNLGFEQTAVIPIHQAGALQGIILLASRPEQNIDLKLIDPIIQLSKIIPVALERLSFTRNAIQRLAELETLAETSQSISLSNDLEGIFKTLHSKVLASFGNVDFSIALYNSLNKTIELPYVSEEGSIKSINPFPLGEGVISVLIRTRQSLMLVDDTERHLNALGAKTVGRAAKSWLGCPLNVASETIGALIVQDLEQEHRFNQDDLHIFRSLADQAAGAINTIRLLEDMRRKALELQTVAEISREISSSLVIDELLRKAVALLHDRFNFYHAAVYLIDSTEENAIVREAAGDIGGQLKRSGQKIVVGSKSVIGNVTEQKEFLVINDTGKDPTYSTIPALLETKAEACFPLVIHEKILGALDVHSLRPFYFTEENIRVLQILADQLAVAVVNSNLFSEAQERLSQHRLLHHVTTSAASASTIQEALNSTVQGLQVTLGGDQISIMMADKEQKSLEVKASIGYPNEESARLKIPFGVGVSGWAASHRKALRIADTTKESRYISVNPRVRSELAIPLVYRNEVLGILNIESTRLNAYSENDEEMLGTLAGSLAAIIAHSQLLEEYRHQVERERLLSEITNKIRRTTNPGLILSIAADELSKTLNTRRTHVEVSLKNEDLAAKLTKPENNIETGSD